jgi:hypothetical protein
MAMTAKKYCQEYNSNFQYTFWPPILGNKFSQNDYITSDTKLMGELSLWIIVTIQVCKIM